MNDSLNHQNNSIASVLARIVFVCYLSFILFWVGNQFAIKITDLNDINTSNNVNQVVILTLFMAACLSLIPLRKELITLFKKERFFLMFMSWCLLSIIWSDYRFVSLKRYFELMTSVIICCAFLLHTTSHERIIKYLTSLFLVYISLNIIAIIFMPAAIDPNFNSWRGIASGKNLLGQTSLMSLLIWFYALRNNSTVNDKMMALFMSVSSFILLLGSKSTTPILTIGILAILGIVFSIDDRVKTIGVGRFFSGLTFITAIGIIITVIKTEPGIITSLPSILGKSTTFSGRSDIWLYIFDEARRHLICGCGYGGFWIIENPKVLELYKSLNIIIFQSHMGYIDILNETGIVGLLLFFLIVVSYFNSLSNPNNKLGLWFVIGILIINFQETTLFRPNSLTGFMFIFFYLYFRIGTINNAKHIYT